MVNHHIGYIMFIVHIVYANQFAAFAFNCFLVFGDEIVVVEHYNFIAF